MSRIVIADTSCLILYQTINRFDIILNTFDQFIVSQEVALEFGQLPSYITIQVFKNRNKYSELLQHLGEGEASSIVLALENENSLLILDEKKGRRIALELGLEIIGSLGLLLIAKKKGVIKSVKEIIQLIDETKFRVSEKIKQKIIEKAEE